jgi:hypothetical protein
LLEQIEKKLFKKRGASTPKAEMHKKPNNPTLMHGILKLIYDKQGKLKINIRYDH